MLRDSEYDEKALFLQIAEGDEKAFTELFHIYTPRLFPFVLKLTKNEQLAQEMIQETFLRLWVNRLELINVRQPASWTFKIAANVSITWLRKYSNRKRILGELSVPGIPEANSVSDELETKELSLIIGRAIETLPERRQQIYRLSREQGLTHQQIAEELDISPITVANQIGIALKFIQQFINKETGLSLLTIFVLLSQ